VSCTRSNTLGSTLFTFTCLGCVHKDNTHSMKSCNIQEGDILQATSPANLSLTYVIHKHCIDVHPGTDVEWRVTKRRERGRGGRENIASRKPKNTLREPTQQHRPTQNTAEAEKAALEHTPTKTEKSNNNHKLQKPEQTRPARPPA
jgi:hypothetical protein